MGVKKASKSSAKKSVGKTIKSVASSALGMVKGTSRKAGGRRHRNTPEKLAKKLLMIKLQKKIWKAKYGGR